MNLPKVFLILLVVFGCHHSSAQTHMDTIVNYMCTLSVVSQGGGKTYSINDQQTTKERYDEVMANNKEKEKCNPCYLVNKDLDDKRISSGIFYYQCKGSEVVENKKEVDDDFEKSKQLSKSIRFCKEGEWKIFGKQEEVIAQEYYLKGEKVSRRKWLKYQKE